MVKSAHDLPYTCHYCGKVGSGHILGRSILIVDGRAIRADYHYECHAKAQARTEANT